MGLEIALCEPEIPQNTGNIMRTCVALGAQLHLIEPLGFSLDNRYLKRAGLDYWYQLSQFTLWPSLDEFLQRKQGAKLYLLSTKAQQLYSDVHYAADAIFLFGKETKGLPDSLLATHQQQAIRIPMREETRSLNLANAVAIVAYEYARQQDFSGLQLAGHLPENYQD